MLHVEWCICWPRMTAKRVEPVVSISWASCYCMWMTHRPSAITHTHEYTVLPGVVRHTFIIFGLFTTPNLCPPGTKSWRRHWMQWQGCSGRRWLWGAEIPHRGPGQNSSWVRAKLPEAPAIVQCYCYASLCPRMPACPTSMLHSSRPINQFEIYKLLHPTVTKTPGFITLRRSVL